MSERTVMIPHNLAVALVDMLRELIASCDITEGRSLAAVEIDVGEGRAALAELCRAIRACDAQVLGDYNLYNG